MLAFLCRRTIKDGAHHVPSDGLGIEAVVVPNDDATLASQQFEGGLSVFFHTFVVVVTIDENHVVLAEMWSEIEGLGVAIELFHIGQILTEEAVQIGILLISC